VRPIKFASLLPGARLLRNVIFSTKYYCINSNIKLIEWSWSSNIWYCAEIK